MLWIETLFVVVEQLDVAVDCRERCTELVRDARDEVVLELVEFAQHRVLGERRANCLAHAQDDEERDDCAASAGDVHFDLPTDDLPNEHGRRNCKGCKEQ